jgi:hypothetical protein
METGIIMLLPVIRLWVAAVNMNNMHRHAIKLGSLNFVIDIPLIKPTARPTNTATGMDKAGDV